ncbi:hypothetical protein SCA6_000759 [Theobroma cacao]
MPPHQDRKPNLAELVASARVVGARRFRSKRIQNPLNRNQDDVETSYAQMAVEINQPLANSIKGTQGVTAGHDDRVLNLIQEIALPLFKGSTNPDDVELWIEETEKAFDAMHFSDEDKGSMIVDDYEAKFDQLSKFATGLVSDDESRAKRFENGLNAHIRKGLAPLHLISYNEVVRRVKSLDAVWKETQEAMKDFQKKSDKDSGFLDKRAFSSTSKFQATKKS